MDIFEVFLPEQKVEVSVTEKEKLVTLFSEIGIKCGIHRILPGEEGTLIDDCFLSRRAKNCIYIRLSHDGFSLFDTTIEQFVSYYTKLDLKKTRNCGPHTVIEVDEYIHSIGLKWKDEA